MENEKQHHDKTLDLIHENIDLAAKLKAAEEKREQNLNNGLAAHERLIEAKATITRLESELVEVKRVRDLHYAEMSRLREIPEPSPWIPVTPSTMPKESDADRNGNVEWLLLDDNLGEIETWQWNYKGPTQHTHWRPTNLPPLPTAAPVDGEREADDGFTSHAAKLMDSWHPNKDPLLFAQEVWKVARASMGKEKP